VSRRQLYDLIPAAVEKIKTRSKAEGGRAMTDNGLFEKGLNTRKQVLGGKYVDADLAGSDDFMMTFQRA
jgi:hypothetical protein